MSRSKPSNHLTANWQVLENSSELAIAAEKFIAAHAEQCCAARGAFHIALAGGRTPGKTYRRLRDITTDWKNWHIYFGDERCLPRDHPERNDSLAQREWLQQVGIPGEQIHRIPAELGPERASLLYTPVIKQLERLDFAVLGLGEDGHTASLFPGNDAGAEQSDPAVIAIRNSPKPPANRVSLSARLLSHARQVLVLISGGNKVQAIANWRAGNSLPISQIASASPLQVMVTADAMDP